jgi:hypothetical protein
MYFPMDVVISCTLPMSVVYAAAIVHKRCFNGCYDRILFVYIDIFSLIMRVRFCSFFYLIYLVFALSLAIIK